MRRFPSWWPSNLLSDDEYRRQKARLLQDAPIPVFWLFGKTGSGKTTIIRYLTGAEDAEIGDGFRPQTRHSRRYDFPSDQQPLVRFLDTRGLGESDYDPADDLREFDKQTHVVIVTVRLTDHALDPVLKPLETIRRAQPHRPVLLALTCLHQAYPGQQHPDPDPFAAGGRKIHIPDAIQRHLEQHKDRFGSLVDRIVPIDLTPIEEGFDQAEFGGQRLREALVELLPGAYRQTMIGLQEIHQPLRDLNLQKATPYILSYSSLAASAAAVPVPWIDLPIVSAIQYHMVLRLQRIYGQKSDARLAAPVLGAIGGHIAGRLALRSLLKIIPIAGPAANSALAYSCTYALGKVCCWYFGELRAGNVPSETEVRQMWRDQLARASRLLRQSHWKEPSP